MKRAILLAAFLVLPLPVVAADKWTSVQSKNFFLVGSASEKQIREVAENLEVFRTAFSRFFAQVKEGSSVATTVVVFKSDQAFKPFKPVYQGKPANIAGYFQPGPDMNFIALAADMPTPRVIYHEYVHRLMSDNLGSLPPWFQEGFAECFSTLEIEGRDKKVRLGRAIGEHVQLLNERRFMPLERLFAVVHGSPEYNEEEKQGLFYAQSWAFVHYMMFNSPERRAQFTTFLDALQKGRPAAEAFQEVFKTDLPTFQRTFEAYIQQRMAWNAFELQTPGGLDRSKEMTARSLTEAEAEFHLGDLLLHTNRLTEAESHLTKAVQLDPKLGKAQASMGRLHMRKSNEAEALAYLERATQLDPGNYLTHYYYAAAIRARKTPPTAAEWATMRSELRKAIELAPQFVEAAEMLAGANLTQNVDIPETVELLAKAVLAAPGKDYLLLQLAYALSQTQQRESARPLTRNLLAKATLDAPIRASAENLMDFLDRAAAAEAANRAFVDRAAAGIAPAEPSADLADAPAVRRTPAPDPDAPIRIAPRTEPLPPGTAKVRGELTLLDCRKGLTLSLAVDGKTVRFHTDSPDRIRFTSYNSAVVREIACGPTPGNGVPAEILYRPGGEGDDLGEPLTVDFIEDPANADLDAALPEIPGTSTLKGSLTHVDCSDGVSITIVSEGKTLRLHNESAGNIAVLNGPNPDRTVTCGPIAGSGLSVVVVYFPEASGESAGRPVIVRFQR